METKEEFKDILMPSQVLDCDFPSISEQREYYFETDHDSLRGNPDYLALLRTMAIVQAQKIQAIQDVEKLLDCRKKALEDPLSFVEKLRRGDIKDLPKRRKLPSMPIIDWNNYNLTSALEDKPETRKCKTVDQGALSDGNITDSQSGKNFESHSEKKKSSQSWSSKKRKQLEELLANYAFEDVESEKWREIKDVVDTLKGQSQVVSQLLITSVNAPNTVAAKFEFKEPQRNKFASNFDRLDWNIAHEHEAPPSKTADNYFFVMEDVSEEEDVDDMKRTSDTYQELMWLKRVRREKEFQLSEGVQIHNGFSCNGCKVEPIRFGRFTCTDCHKIGTDIHFCCECVPKLIELPHYGHFKDHVMRPARQRPV